MLKRVGSMLVAVATLAACSESTVPTGITPDVPSSPQNVLATLSCRGDVAANKISCSPESPAGISADVILGGQNTYVKLTSSGVVNNGTTITANLNVQNLTAQPWGTADGTTPTGQGVRVFFHTGPTNGVTVANPTDSAAYTSSSKQPYFEYSGADLGGDGILSSGETSSNKSWVFNLNGQSTFAFQLYITTKLPADLGVLRWTPTSAGSAAYMNAVWGSSANDVWAVGEKGSSAILHYTGGSWTAAAGAESEDINAVWGTSSSNVYAVGGLGQIQRYNGTSWSDVGFTAAQTLSAVWGSSATNIYAAGFQGAVVRYDGTSWSAVTTGIPTSQYLNAIWGSSASNVYIVGEVLGGAGVLWKYDGTSWTQVDVSAVNTGNEKLRAIWGTSASDIWVAGTNGFMMHYNGSSWTQTTGFGSSAFSSISGTSSSDVWAVNRAGQIWHFNGSTWVSFTSPSAFLLGVYASGTQDAWAVGTNSGFTANVLVHGTR